MVISAFLLVNLSDSLFFINSSAPFRNEDTEAKPAACRMNTVSIKLIIRANIGKH